MSTAIQKSAIDELKHYMGLSKIQQVFNEMLGENAGVFVNTITNIVRGSTALQKCSPQSIVSSAIDAAALDLPVDPSLGLAAIVPYKGKAQFQIMYKGLIQLCIRSGLYASIDCTEIYADELLSHNPITGVVKFKDPANYKMRYKKQDKDVIGHYASFRLTTGFEKSDYMSHEEAMAHGVKYSKAYQYDIKEKKKASPWSLMPIPMCNKTVLIRLFSKYGLKSIKMQAMLFKDNSFEAAQEAANEQIESQQGSEVVDAEFEKHEPTEETEQLTPQQKAAKTRADNKAKKEKADAEKKATEQQGNDEQFKWFCKEPGCGLKFNEPKVSGVGDNAKQCCPNVQCLSLNIEEVPF